MLWATRFRTIQIHQVEPSRTFRGKLPGDCNWIVEVNGLLSVVSLAQPYASTSAKVDRGKKDQEPRFPFVELESLRSDCRVAWCNAMPNALNVASQTWWSFSPLNFLR